MSKETYSAVARILKVTLIRTDNKQWRKTEEASVFLHNTYVFMNTIWKVKHSQSEKLELIR